MPSRGYDVTSDEPTHTGRGIEASFLQIIEDEEPEPTPEEENKEEDNNA